MTDEEELPTFFSDILRSSVEFHEIEGDDIQTDDDLQDLSARVLTGVS